MCLDYGRRRRSRPDVGKRRPNGASSVYQGVDGWHGRVTVGVKNDGSPDRRHVRGATESIVIKKVRDLEKRRDAGQVTRPGSRWTVQAWLEHWLEQIARPGLRVQQL
jgi:integrase